MSEYDAQKFVILRKNGEQPSWPAFVLNLNDEGAYPALTAYVEFYSKANADPDYLTFLYDLLSQAEEFSEGRGWSRADQPSQHSTTGNAAEIMEALRGGNSLHEALIAGLPRLVARTQVTRMKRIFDALVRKLVS